MRKIIAQRMIESRRTSAHVHAMFEVDLTRIVNLRNKLKNSFEQRNGARLTFMPFFVRAAIIALQQFPIVNASLEGDSVRYHRHVNAGIAVALDWGLIVPVLKNADELNFLGLQRGITDLGERAPPRSSCPLTSKARPSPSPTPASSAPCSASPSSISQTPPSWESAASASSPW
jgi:pyruvate dehydrogenase E2 component (dihydrolipoamide acetyltransferase)